MTIEVIDFYTRKKISTHPSFSITMSETEFTLLVEHNKKVREFTLNVPKKYQYKSTLFNYCDFKPLKLKEVNVLTDFIRNNRAHVQTKWNLSDTEVRELPRAIELCLVMNFTNCSFIKKIVMMCIAKLSLALVRL